MTTERERFVERYGGIYEHSPWVAERAFDRLGSGYQSTEVRAALATSVDRASADRQLALIRAHPDLAGKAALRGALTSESSAEQASAGIDQCSETELAQFKDLNARYKAKFGFPFVLAVRGRHRREILTAFAARLDNTPEEEFATALREIHEIARLRLAQLEEHDDA